MKAATVSLCALLALAGFASPAHAGKLRTLGTDPSGDAPPALDITYLKVGRAGPSLDIRIGVEGMLPRLSGYPELPGIEWIFDVGGRTFVAEGVARTGGPAFYLFELVDGSFQQLESPEGTYDPEDGYIKMLVPLKTIGARAGTRISGTGPKGTEDVDAHVHLGPQSYFADMMATSKDFVVP